MKRSSHQAVSREVLILSMRTWTLKSNRLVTFFCRVPASSRRQKISMILQIAPLTDKISVLGGIVVPIADVGCQKKSSVMVKVGLSRFEKMIGELASVYHRNFMAVNGGDR